MPNTFIRRKMSNASLLSRRALRRRATPSEGQKQRRLHELKRIATKRIRRSLQERDEPTDA